MACAIPGVLREGSLPRPCGGGLIQVKSGSRLIHVKKALKTACSVCRDPRWFYDVVFIGSGLASGAGPLCQVRREGG